jgi:hypothetical protein
MRELQAKQCKVKMGTSSLPEAITSCSEVRLGHKSSLWKYIEP